MFAVDKEKEGLCKFVKLNLFKHKFISYSNDLERNAVSTPKDNPISLLAFGLISIAQTFLAGLINKMTR